MVSLYHIDDRVELHSHEEQVFSRMLAAHWDSCYLQHYFAYSQRPRHYFGVWVRVHVPPFLFRVFLRARFEL